MLLESAPMERKANEVDWQGKILLGCKMMENFSQSQREICIKDSSEGFLRMHEEIFMTLVCDLEQRNTEEVCIY